jgi:glutamyl-tRNA synthetase
VTAPAVRVRFAPSPTGALHLGGALTALLNLLFARSSEGVMLLRIDDTDASRTDPDAERRILDDLGWLGIGWDEGPLRQSERADRHREAAAGVEGAAIRDGAVYLAPEGVPPFVILRADGSPTYHWASVVDDLDMGITHVIRGGDHRPNQPLHEAAFRALGAAPPEFVHHAVVLGESGKLSKREGGASVADLRAAGYPATAVVNLLGLIASSGPGDVMTLADLVARFDRRRIAGGEVRIEESRLRALSAAHLAAMASAQLVEQVLERCPPGTPRAAVEALAPALRGTHTLVEMAALVDGVVRPAGTNPLPELAEVRAGYPERLTEAEARSVVDELRRRGIPLRAARLALTGREHGPELWAVIAALDRDEAVRRAA